MAGVHQNHIGIVGRVRLDIALTAQRLGHAFTVIDIHLAAIGLDKQLFRIGHRGTTGQIIDGARCNAVRLCLQWRLH